MKARIRSRKSSTDVQLPRLSNRRTPMLNQSASWFSHLVCFGLYRTRRRWLASLKNAAPVDIDGNSPRCSFSPRASALSQGLAPSRTKASDVCGWS
jgi:hypothetical protein